MTEAQLARHYGVGRSPVRSALGRLQQDHLVRAIPRKGYEIAPVTLQGVRDLFALRLLLEPPATRQASGRVDPVRLRELDDELRTMRYQPGDRDSATEFLRVNARFHLTIVAAAGNQRLTDLLASLLNEMDRLFHFGLMRRDRNDEMYHEHHELVEALLADDGSKAEQVVREQIRSSEAMVVDALLHSTNLSSLSLTRRPAGGDRSVETTSRWDLGKEGHD